MESGLEWIWFILNLQVQYAQQSPTNPRLFREEIGRNTEVSRCGFQKQFCFSSYSATAPTQRCGIKCPPNTLKTTSPAPALILLPAFTGRVFATPGMTLATGHHHYDSKNQNGHKKFFHAASLNQVARPASLRHIGSVA